MDIMDPCSSLTWKIILANQYTIQPLLVLEEDFAEPRMVQRMVHYKYRQWLLNVFVV
jgi:hypothetical protein